MNYWCKEHKKYSLYIHMFMCCWESLICVCDQPSPSCILTHLNLIRLPKGQSRQKCLLLLRGAAEVTQFCRFPEPRSQTCVLQSAREVLRHALVASGSRLPAGVRSRGGSSTNQLRRTEEAQNTEEEQSSS